MLARKPLKGNEAITRSMWERETTARREIQPARAVHRLHRLRVDVHAGREQPAPQRDLSRRQGQGRSDHPFSQYDSVDPEDLWKWMSRDRAEDGRPRAGHPHNGNLRVV